ncbi:hypothetical protein WA026_016057 [Henosepilachna vigintioctopunctata]|uniref:Large ribosomal subunit protein mL52 n=1 Tax=Henosepilachna vigintioctopunctata TaxID=420089 RepID=A0AAW1U3H3_9CUCU
MAMYKTFLGNHIIQKLSLVYIRNVSTSCSNNLIQKWRKERGLPINPNSYGVLTDGPDYSFQDNRPTPYGMRQMKRITKQKELAEKIINLTCEVDYAVHRYEQINKNKSEERNRLLSSKLKAKGAALLKKR